MKTIKKIGLILIFLAILTAAGTFVAPGFLLYKTPFEKSDAIVLMLGPDFSARQRHAQNLMQMGMAEYLIIPAYHKVYILDQGVIKNITSKTERKNAYGKSNTLAPHYFEDTHLELLDAKKTMDHYGKKTAIFVSSPYHMRRIHVIASHIFGNEGKNYFSPTPYETAPENVRQMQPSDWKKVWREYLKISWFMIYSQWSKA